MNITKKDIGRKVSLRDGTIATITSCRAPNTLFPVVYKMYKKYGYDRPLVCRADGTSALDRPHRPHRFDIIAFADESPPPCLTRSSILDTAKEYVTKDRNTTHGEPENSFSDIAKLWSAYLGTEVRPHDVPVMMALLKVARIKTAPENDDNWIDLAGYAACGGELAVSRKNKDEK